MAASFPVRLVHHLIEEAKLVLIFQFLKEVTISSKDTLGGMGGGRGVVSV